MAKPHQINTLAQLVAKAESGANQFALRFEPKWNTQHWPLVLRFNKCTEETAMVVGATSWGLYQIMGDNLYGLGLDCPIGQFLSDSTLQTLYFAKFLNSRSINMGLSEFIENKTSALNFCHHYNGNPGAYWSYLWDLLKLDGWEPPPAAAQPMGTEPAAPTA